MKKLFKQKNKAFTLVETLVAISIFTISILGIMSVLASSITSVTYAKDKSIAGYLAQEGIEYMRNIRDNDVLYPANNSSWSDFTNTATASSLASCNSSNKCGFNSSTTPTNSITFFKCSADPTELPPATGCVLYLNNSNGIYNDNAISGSSSGFTREVWMTYINANEVQIFSEVDWNQGTIPESVIFSENLFNWES